ncbi:MAG: peptidoglycan DD-metalloendopeptidase family protein [Bacteroidia bacterium]|nr:peptidoglycan DD-metalloendopeptidase family protein [Bacteroidia bacterium]
MKLNINMKSYLYDIVLVVIFISCGFNEPGKSNAIKNLINDNVPELSTVDNILDTLIADGFDFPVGNVDGKGKYTSIADGKVYDSWYIATKFAENYSLGVHPGIDLNGTGGGNTDQGQPVYTIGKGVVIDSENFGSPWGNVVLIKHYYLENGKIISCFSLYAHLEEIFVSKGDVVKKRTKIGTIGTGGGSYPAHLHLEIRKDKMKDYETTFWPGSNSKNTEWVKEYYEAPDEFINSHRVLTCPYKEDRIIVAVKNKYKLFYYEKGELKNEYVIALSQNPNGPKEKEGDLKMPEGEYFIFGKQKGPFYGDFSEYLGNELLRISYPNTFDAEKAYSNGNITKEIRDKITSANKKQIAPPQSTFLGGGIVIHGWFGDWIADGNQNLTWGCISMHNSDLEKFYDIVQLKTKIIILP